MPPSGLIWTVRDFLREGNRVAAARLAGEGFAQSLLQGETGTMRELESWIYACGLSYEDMPQACFGALLMGALAPRPSSAR